MSCAQPQAEAVSLEQKARFLLKIYKIPVVAEIFLLSLGFKLDKIGPVVAQRFLLFIFEAVFSWEVVLTGRSLTFDLVP